MTLRDAAAGELTQGSNGTGTAREIGRLQLYGVMDGN
jgi:hypothetical protein